ncbi:ATP-dependent helicase [Candidatus Laterigemmans baculatus]|uniref:ATP-dependent helicase n=1 Tax=Candidatus Laterigemmans baculatus TaxID=2770505 RepID=UPI0013DD3806|nr:UvrD-helicase domain-containing protein [Candidatus Laterigemmans baculatus]
MNGLNAPQKAAVETLSGPLLVLAGAGSGKTRVVTFRIANLIRHGTAPDRILAVTFTNKAAGEMQERIGSLIGKGGKFRKGQPRPVIGTFHSQCVRILRRHARRLEYPEQFAIYDRGDQESLARGVLRQLKLPTAAIRPGDLLSILGTWKNASIGPEQALAVARTDKEHLAAAAYRRYQEGLKACGAMDFDDLLLNTERLFAQHEDIREHEAKRFDHVLVDEYQDTNGSQYRIIRALADGHRNLCVVGDDDQSIYGWRGADVTHILNFTKDWPDAKVVRLEHNYRSVGAILTMANTLIKYNTKRHDKQLIPARPAGTRPRILQMKDETTEAETIAGEIARMLDRKHYEPREVAILFRTKEQPRLFETELRKAKVPYVLLGSQSFYDRREIRDILAYLKWIDQPDDEVSLLRIINTPPRGLGAKTVQEIVRRAVASGRSAWAVCSDAAATEDLPPAAKRGIDSLRMLISDVRMKAKTHSLAESVRTLLERTQYMDEVRRLYENPDEREARSNSLQEVVNAVAAYEDRESSPTLSDFLSETALAGREMGSEKDKAAARNAVWLLTLHAAKGLEFPVVYMVGMEEGILPHHRSVAGEDEQIAEERRLCYVGITRAQETLTLSMCLARRKWGQLRPTTPSRFLYEITGKADNPNKYRKAKISR